MCLPNYVSLSYMTESCCIITSVIHIYIYIYMYRQGSHNY